MKKLMMIAAAAIVVSCGNKQQAQLTEDDSTIVTKDSIELVNEQVETQDAFDNQAIEKIKEFYQKYVFGNEELTDEVVNKYCTKKLVKKLADDYEYEYDGGGYAVWNFRSGNQDGDEDTQEVMSVEALGNHTYQVHYNDLGAKGNCVISVVGEEILFDEIISNSTY